MEQKIKNILCDLATRIRLFQALNQEELSVICGYLNLETFPKGAYIFQEGEPGDWMGFIVSGKLEVQKSTTFPGKHLIMGYMSKGSVIGEMSVIEKYNRSGSVLAVENTELLILKKSQLEDIIQHYPIIGAKLLKGLAWILSRRLRQLGDRMRMIV